MGSFLNNAMGTSNNFSAQAAPIQGQDFTGNLAQNKGQFNSTFNNQSALAGQLQQQAMGQGPNPAQIQLQQATNRNVQQNAGFLSSQKGLSPALAARLAAQNQAQSGQQMAGQGALMGAQQQISAQGQLANLYGQQQQGAANMYGQNQNAMAAYNNAEVGNTSNMNNVNAGVAAQNSATSAGLMGGLMNAAGGGAASGMLGGGGSGGGGGGMAGMAMLAAYKGGMIPKNYADGGMATPQWGYSLMPQVDNDYSMLHSFQNSGSASLAAGVAGATGSKPPQQAQPQLQQLQQPTLGQSAGYGPSQMGGSDPLGVGSLAPPPAVDQLSMPSMGSSAGFAHGGDVQGTVPGRAEVSGDSLKNDKVPAMVSPGEIVIPRHITMHPNAPEMAAKFVAQELAKHGNGSKKNYADGGVIDTIKGWVNNNTQSQATNQGNTANGYAQDPRSIPVIYPNDSKYGSNKIANYDDGGYVDPHVSDIPPMGLSSSAPDVNNPAAVPNHVSPSDDQSAYIDANGGQGRMMSEGVGPKIMRGLESAGHTFANAGIGTYQNPPSQDPTDAHDPSTPTTGSTPTDPYGGGPAINPSNPKTMAAAAGAPSSGGVDTHSQALEDLAKQNTAMTVDRNYNQGQKQFDIDTERDLAYQAYKSGQVDPNRYFNTMGTGGKISTMVGLLLSGLGSGLTGKPNMAMEMINKHIDEDVKAQQANMDKNKNLVGMNFQRSGDLRAATEMSRIQQQDLISDKLQEVETNTKDPLVRNRAAVMRQQLQIQSAQGAMQLKMYQQMGAGAGGQQSPEQYLQGLRMVNPQMAKEMESRLVPGAGFATVPIEPKVREEMVARKSLQDQVQNLRQWAKEHTGSMNLSDIQYGKTLASNVQDAYRRANGQGVFREGEANFVKGIVESDPTKFFNAYRVDPKYRALEDSNNMALQGLYRGYGLSPSNTQRPAPSGYVAKHFRKK